VVVAAAPRLTSHRLAAEPTTIDVDAWEGTRLVLPPTGCAGFRHLFTGAWLRPDETGRYLQAGQLFRTCPVALLVGTAEHELPSTNS
jgi:hypothetical protein